MYRITLRRTTAVELCAVAALGIALAGQARAGEPAGDAWQFEVTPYVFGAGLRGTTGVGQVRADIDSSFGDILKHFDSGLMGAAEARKGPWGFAFDGVYFRLKDQATRSWEGPGGIGSGTGELDATVSQLVYQLAVAYRVRDDSRKVDVFGAGRYTRLDTDLNLVTTTGPLLPGGNRSLSASADWWDPVIGFRVILPFAERWSFVGYGDVGGFGVGSKITWQAIAGANWEFAKSFTAKIGYRYMYQDYDKNNFLWKMAAHGAYVGLGIAF
jgi:opacity protein-like surface antigen